MIKLHLQVVLPDPGPNGMPLCNVDLSTLTEDGCFQAMVIPNRLKETDNLPRQEAYNFDIVSVEPC
jgi:hypothetical protein